jgi:uncharacterized protein (TIGR02646 family)
MDQFVRTAEPAALAQERNELCQGEYVATKVWDTFRKRKAYQTVRDQLLQISFDTCAFCSGGFAQSNETIEHFIPKSGVNADATQVLAWANLFPACGACQTAKLDKYSGDLLKPDATDYLPQTYFWIEAHDGSLVPSPAASQAQQQQAKTTIDTYKLDRSALKKERRKALRDFEREGTDALHHYRFIAELLA